MTFKQLKYVTEVADTGNITEAAKRLFIAQPSLTASIQELEKEYGITIFKRNKKGIEITPEGEEFLGYARQVLIQAISTCTCERTSLTIILSLNG